MDCAGAEYTVCKQLLIPITNWRQAILEWSCGELTVCIRRQRLISWTPSVTTRTIWQTEHKNIPSYWCSLHNPNPNTKSIQSSSFCEMLNTMYITILIHFALISPSILQLTQDQTQPQADLRVRSLPAAPLVHGQVQQTWGPHQLLIWKMNHLAALYLKELMD